jgi:signal transduction histidine kinase
LNALQQEPDVLPVSTNGGPGPGLGGDEIDREIFLMHDAIRRVRDLRRFVADALHGLPDATLVLGADGQVLLANEEAQSLFRATAAETLAGRDLSALLDAIAVVDPESSASRGDPAWTAPQLEIHTRIGQALELRSTVFRDSAGAFTGWIVRLSDITAMKTAARQREQVMQLLSHDMRSPQVSILALLRARQPDAPIPAEQARRIDGYAQHTLALADDFLSLARAEQPHYTIEAVNFADLLIEAIDALWPQSHAKSVTLNAEGCDQDYPVAGDRSLLLRALVNLIDNAIKFSAPNSAVHCALSRLEAPDQAVCTIRDHGRGMSAETRGGLFQPFHRGTQDGPAVGGVGLGLTFVRTVVLRHHGQIACDSVLGAGTTFTIALPLTTGDLETA